MIDKEARLLTGPFHWRIEMKSKDLQDVSFVVLGKQFLVALIKRHDRRSATITADLYRNLDDYRRGAVMVAGARMRV